MKKSTCNTHPLGFGDEKHLNFVCGFNKALYGVKKAQVGLGMRKLTFFFVKCGFKRCIVNFYTKKVSVEG